MTGPDALLLRDVEVAGRRTAVLVSGPRIVAVGPGIGRPRSAVVVDGAGGALLPGLHDHHVHLAATAALSRSVAVGPPAVRSIGELGRALAAAPERSGAGGWVRGVGYHESVAGDLDRWALDRLLPHRPVRIQHRSGARWTLNSAAIRVLDLDREVHPRIERDPAGEPTGRLHRLDRWLGRRLPDDGPPDLAGLGRRLASYGVTGATDATPHADPSGPSLLAGAAASGALPVDVVVTGGIELADVPAPAPLERGPVKLVIDDSCYPSLAELGSWIDTAHRCGRAVAVHCVTRVALTLAVAAWDMVGARPGDRVEHGAVVPPELRTRVRHHRLTVVTQPGLVAERGDEYLADVDPDDVGHLYPCASLLAAGIAVAGSTDSPYTDPDPWRAVAAACHRTTPSGHVLGPHEVLPAAAALALFLGDRHDPGGPARTVGAGRPADLCLLHVPLGEALRAPSSAHVRLTVRGGRVTAGLDRA